MTDKYVSITVDALKTLNDKLRIAESKAEAWRAQWIETWSMLDLARRVQRQETSMKITAQRALDDAQKRIAHLEAQDRATVNAYNERHADPSAIQRAANIIACERERRHRWEEWYGEARHELSASNERIADLEGFIEKWRERCYTLERKLTNEKRAYQETKAKFKLWRERSHGFEWNARLWEETCGAMSRKVGEAEDQLQRGRDYWHGRVEELMVANRTLAAKFDRMGVSREEIIDEVARLKGLLHVAQDNLNRRDQNPYKRIDELMAQLEHSRKHLDASRTIRKRRLKNIQRLQQENLGLITDRDHWQRSFHEVEVLGRSIADWAYAEMNRREWGMIDRKVWNAIEDLRTTTRPEGS